MFSACIFLDQRNRSRKRSHYFSASSRAPTLLCSLAFLGWPPPSSMGPERPQHHDLIRPRGLGPGTISPLPPSLPSSAFPRLIFSPSPMWGPLIASSSGTTHPVSLRAVAWTVYCPQRGLLSGILPRSAGRTPLSRPTPPPVIREERPASRTALREHRPLFSPGSS